MKGAVELDELDAVIVNQRLLSLRQDIGDRFNVRGSESGRGALGDETLERRAKFVQVANVRFGQRRHYQSRSSMAGDQSFVLQDAHCFANRLPADLQLGGKRFLPQHLSRRQFAQRDGLAKPLRNQLSQISELLDAHAAELWQRMTHGHLNQPWDTGCRACWRTQSTIVCNGVS